MADGAQQSFRQAQVWGQWGTAVGSLGSGLTSAFGAVGAGFDLYDKVGPGRRHTRQTRKLEIKRLKALLEQLQAQTALYQASAGALGRLGAGLTESANAQQLILHVLST